MVFFYKTSGERQLVFDATMGGTLEARSRGLGYSQGLLRSAGEWWRGVSTGSGMMLALGTVLGMRRLAQGQTKVHQGEYSESLRFLPASLLTRRPLAEHCEGTEQLHNFVYQVSGLSQGIA
jgi:hypothetical protein